MFAVIAGTNLPRDCDETPSCSGSLYDHHRHHHRQLLGARLGLYHHQLARHQRPDAHWRSSCHLASDRRVLRHRRRRCRCLSQAADDVSVIAPGIYQIWARHLGGVLTSMVGLFSPCPSPPDGSKVTHMYWCLNVAFNTYVNMQEALVTLYC